MSKHTLANYQSNIQDLLNSQNCELTALYVLLSGLNTPELIDEYMQLFSPKPISELRNYVHTMLQMLEAYETHIKDEAEYTGWYRFVKDLDLTFESLIHPEYTSKTNNHPEYRTVINYFTGDFIRTLTPDVVFNYETEYEAWVTGIIPKEYVERVDFDPYDSSEPGEEFNAYKYVDASGSRHRIWDYTYFLF